MSAKEDLQFVDTNILVYAYDVSAGQKRALAKALVQKLWENKAGCLSVQVLQEFYVNLTRKAAMPLDAELVAQIVEDLNAWRVHIPDGTDVLGAIRIQQKYQLNFWDAMIIRSTSETGCALLWSEDFSDGKVYEGVKVNNPFTQAVGLT